MDKQSDLLDMLEETGVHSTMQLAERLGISTELVEARLWNYERMGYVRRTVMQADCGGQCKTCRGCSGLRRSTASVVYWEKVRNA